MAAPLIRPMEPGDIAAVVDVLMAGNAEHLATFPPSLAAGYGAELRDVAGRQPWAETYVAVEGDRVVGTVTFVPDADDDSRPWPPGGSVIRFLAVSPSDRGGRLGERLTTLCIDRARARGSSFVGLHTAPVMAAARRTYEQLGFERAPEHDFDPTAHYGGADESDDPPWGLAYVLRLADED